MSRKKHTAEQVVNLLRQVEVAVAHGKTTAQAANLSLDNLVLQDFARGNFLEFVHKLLDE